MQEHHMGLHIAPGSNTVREAVLAHTPVWSLVALPAVRCCVGIEKMYLSACYQERLDINEDYV